MKQALSKKRRTRSRGRDESNGASRLGSMRRRARERIDVLSPERLQVAADFLAYLEERESNDATEELLRIPGFAKAFQQGLKDVAAGRLKDWRKVRRDV